MYRLACAAVCCGGEALLLRRHTRPHLCACALGMAARRRQGPKAHSSTPPGSASTCRAHLCSPWTASDRAISQALIGVSTIPKTFTKEILGSMLRCAPLRAWGPLHPPCHTADPPLGFSSAHRAARSRWPFTIVAFGGRLLTQCWLALQLGGSAHCLCSLQSDFQVRGLGGGRLRVHEQQVRLLQRQSLRPGADR